VGEITEGLHIQERRILASFFRTKYGLREERRTDQQEHKRRRNLKNHEQGKKKKEPNL